MTPSIGATIEVYSRLSSAWLCSACARASAQVLELAAILVERGHLNAVGESGVAAQAAQAALRASALNVSINLGSIKEQAFVESRLAELEQIVRQYGSLDARINELLAQRLA